MESFSFQQLRAYRTAAILLSLVLAVDAVARASYGAESSPHRHRQSESVAGRRWGGAFMEYAHGHVDARMDQQTKDERIVGGAKTNRTAFPYIVLLSILKDNDEFFCGGTLIDRQYVVTAAHCVLNSSVLVVPARSITVYAGSTLQKQGTKVGVNRVWSHPSFNFYANDVALLQLRSALRITPTVMPIKLAYDDTPLKDGSDLSISGWGSLSAGAGSVAANLQGATVNYLPNGCGRYKKPDYSEYVPSVMICAGCNAGRVDTCQGDSGGPLTTLSVSNGCPILAGLTSFGEGCADAGFPGVYTRLSSQVSWLEKQAGRVFRSQYAMAPPSTCDTCAGATKGKCGLAPGFNANACQIEGYLASAFVVRLKTCSKSATGASLPIEALFNPVSFGTFKPTGSVFFLRSQSEGSSTVNLGGVNVIVPLSGPVDFRNGTFYRSYWRTLWLPDADVPTRTCSNYYTYAAAYISSDKKFIQVSNTMRTTRSV
ncbi:hypothetical protein CBR_g36639 [Chara braunii]|uniref:Peptidase S1 domain-containing protein n=1 Tax=Chara braunii TaxID=69332 RepID=A0A388LL17_CHABU|nr:hypothetical protein CBR_g36639 [Chara braunii]|eukprot:GBG83020.1 hypothetical protein CBR_g36639 [Chara braunii]